MVNKDRLLLFRKIALFLFLFLQIYTGWKNLQYIKSAEYNASESVAEWERRFERLKKVLPITRGVVGYVSDSGVTGINYDNANDQIEYTLTQYTMAPIIINKGVNFEWNIGVLSKPAYEDWVRSHGAGFEIIFLKYNIYLIHRLNK
jgi:hypothetical protein